jgi:arylsulfatase A-like enzyme
MPVPDFPAEMNAKRHDGFFSDDEIRKATVGYYAMVSEVDHWVGKIMNALKESGQDENTIIVFTCDHGEWLGEHLRYGKGYWAPDIVSCVPMIYNVPKALGGYSGVQRDDIVECVDIVPSLLCLAGIPVPPDIQGRVLAIADNMTETKGDGCGLTEHTGWKSLRTDKYRYVTNADGTELLFDTEKDPMDYNNLANDPAYKDTLYELRGLLIRRMLRIESPLRRDFSY